MDGASSQIPWRLIGDAETLQKKRCQRLHAKAGARADLVLVFAKGKFYAMEAWCSHMGKPDAI